LQKTTAELLAGLLGPARNSAWRRFLERYATLLMRIARQYSRDHDERNDCFLHICEKLCENDFHRLQRYQPESSASFRGWLAAVATNLCLDWRRARFGRPRPFTNIIELGELEQRVFNLRFQQRLGQNACLAALQPEYPGLDSSGFEAAVHRINTVLSPRQRWILGARHRQTNTRCSGELAEPRDPAPGPDRIADRAQQNAQLELALSQLSSQYRMVLLMRFQQDLSLKEISRLMRLGDPFRARRLVQSALEELAQLFGR